MQPKPLVVLGAGAWGTALAVAAAARQPVWLWARDPAQAQAMQQLYRKHNVNPLGGCLPALIQLPIFIGLYRGLAVDVELRGSALFSENIHWCSNLAAPDMLYNWSGWMPRPVVDYLGPYLNVLPLVTIGLFLLQQQMFMPEPTNEQAAMQQKIDTIAGK